MPRHAGQVQQHREPRRALHQGADRRTAEAENQVPLPMPRHGPVVRLRRALADLHLGRHMRLSPASRPRPRHAQRPPGAQARRQLPPQRAAALDVERLVDGLVAYPHRLIAGEVEPQPPGDPLWAPCTRPAPMLPRPVPAARPRHRRSGHRGPARSGHGARQPVLHIRPQRRPRHELRRLRAPRRPLGMPLRRRGPVPQPAAAGRGIAPQLARDRRRRPPQPPGDLPHAMPLRTPQRDLLALRERQAPP